MPAATVAAMLKPVDAFYGFWNNGSATLLKAALSPRFVDHTLPKGRPQGPARPAAASKAFLGAVPDLRIAVVQRLVVGDRVVSHLRFTGHFTGTFMGTKGTGQPIDFIATDLLRVVGGRSPTTGTSRTISPSSNRSAWSPPPDRRSPPSSSCGAFTTIKPPSGGAALENPIANKDTAFTAEERTSLGLEGLLPAAIETLDTQVERVLGHLAAKPDALE